MDSALERFMKQRGAYEDYMKALKLGWNTRIPIEVIEINNDTTSKKVAVKGISLIKMP